MFERFTRDARQAVVVAQEEARQMGLNYIGTEHLLLGVCGVASGRLGNLLGERGATADALRQEIHGMVAPGKGSPAHHIPFTPRAKKVLELSLREALALGHSWIGAGHLAVALLRDGEGVGGRVLSDHGVTLDDLRNAVQVDAASEGTTRAEPNVAGKDFAKTVMSAVRARFGRDPEWWERLTPGAKRAIEMARNRADGGDVRTDHLLLGLLDEGEGTAARVLADLGVTVDAVSARTEERGPSDSPTVPDAAARWLAERHPNLAGDPDALARALDDLLAHAPDATDALRRFLAAPGGGSVEPAGGRLDDPEGGRQDDGEQDDEDSGGGDVG